MRCSEMLNAGLHASAPMTGDANVALRCATYVERNDMQRHGSCMFAVLLLLCDTNTSRVRTGSACMPNSSGLRLIAGPSVFHPAATPAHLSGTPLEEGVLLAPGFLGGNQMRALPTAFASSLPTRRMFISRTMTRRKSLFSRGSRWRTVGASLELALPASENGSWVRVRRDFGDRLRRS
jgi:hypothetical protein